MLNFSFIYTSVLYLRILWSSAIQILPILKELNGLYRGRRNFRGMDHSKIPFEFEWLHCDFTLSRKVLKPLINYEDSRAYRFIMGQEEPYL